MLPSPAEQCVPDCPTAHPKASGETRDLTRSAAVRCLEKSHLCVAHLCAPNVFALRLSSMQPLVAVILLGRAPSQVGGAVVGSVSIEVCNFLSGGPWAMKCQGNQLMHTPGFICVGPPEIHAASSIGINPGPEGALSAHATNSPPVGGFIFCEAWDYPPLFTEVVELIRRPDLDVPCHHGGDRWCSHAVSGRGRPER